MRPKWLTPRQNCHPDRSVPGFPTSRCSNDCVCGFLQENRMMLINATGLNRKSGERSGGTCGFFPSLKNSDLRHPSPLVIPTPEAQWKDLQAPCASLNPSSARTSIQKPTTRERDQRRRRSGEQKYQISPADAVQRDRRQSMSPGPPVGTNYSGRTFCAGVKE